MVGSIYNTRYLYRSILLAVLMACGGIEIINAQPTASAQQLLAKKLLAKKLLAKKKASQKNKKTKKTKKKLGAKKSTAKKTAKKTKTIKKVVKKTTPILPAKTSVLPAKNIPKKDIKNIPVKNRKPASYAYLAKNPDAYKFERNQYKNFVDTILAQEATLSNNYYVFYHGQRRSLRVIQDVLNEIFTFLHIDKQLNAFHFLRFWKDTVPTAQANLFINTTEKQYGWTKSYWNDNEPYLVKNLLSVNLSLFGNYTYPGESTFYYFLSNTSINGGDIDKMLNDICLKLGIHISYTTLNTLVNLKYKLPNTHGGNLLQIAIPKSLVDTCAFVCKPWGTPYRSPIVSSVYDTSLQRHTAIAPILEAYCTEKLSLDPMTIDRLQARIILSQDIMLNPKSGVKIYRYTFDDPSLLAAYKKELQAVVNDVMNGWAFAHTYGPQDTEQLADTVYQLLG